MAKLIFARAHVNSIHVLFSHIYFWFLLILLVTFDGSSQQGGKSLNIEFGILHSGFITMGFEMVFILALVWLWYFIHSFRDGICL